MYSMISGLFFNFQQKLENVEVGSLDQNSFGEENIIEDVNELDVDEFHLEEDENFDEREEKIGDLSYDENMDKNDADIIERLYEDENDGEYDAEIDERQYYDEKLGTTEAWDYDEEEEDEYDELDRKEQGDYRI